MYNELVVIMYSIAEFAYVKARDPYSNNEMEDELECQETVESWISNNNRRASRSSKRMVVFNVVTRQIYDIHLGAGAL